METNNDIQALSESQINDLYLEPKFWLHGQPEQSDFLPVEFARAILAASQQPAAAPAAPDVQVQDVLAAAAARVCKADAAYKAQSNLPSAEKAQEYQAALSALVAAALTKGQK